MSIDLQSISYTYMRGTPFEKKALDDVSLSIAKGEIVAVIGHTGSGKSTLVQHLNGLLKPDAGRVAVDGVNLSGKNAAAKKARQLVGMVFQYPEHQIFAETVYEDIAFGPRNRGFQEAEVDKQDEYEQHHRRTKQGFSVQIRCIAHFHNDIRRHGADTAENAVGQNRLIPCNHDNRHGFPDGTPDTKHNPCQNPLLCRRQHSEEYASFMRCPQP